jgi:glycosyltransferase involved in cell wall biosynthesis
MSSQPYFSVIVPAFNAAETLEASLNSLIIQGFRDWECLVVDDGSEDDSFELATNLASKDSRISVYSQKVNRGPGPPSNFGIGKSKGKYVLFLHSDDELEPGALEALFNRAEAHSPNVIFFGAIGRQGNRRHQLHDEE